MSEEALSKLLIDLSEHGKLILIHLVHQWPYAWNMTTQSMAFEGADGSNLFILSMYGGGQLTIGDRKAAISEGVAATLVDRYSGNQQQRSVRILLENLSPSDIPGLINVLLDE